MLGLNPDSNVINNGLQNKRSHKFAEKLNGRFFVAGISGSFQKHRKEQLGIIDKSESTKTEKYAYQPVLEKRQKEMLQQEAIALIEMEEKLNEIKRVKEGRKRRNEQRAVNKLRYKSVETIRKAFQRFKHRKYSAAIGTVLAFLRVTSRKQALSTAVWAIGVLKRFGWKAVYVWRKRRAYLQAIRLSAHMNWSFIQEIACLWTQARRNVADECVFNSIKVAVQLAKKHILATDGYVHPPPPVAYKVGRRSSFMNNSPSVQGRKGSFFITSTDAEYTNQQQRGGGDDSSIGESIRRFQNNYLVVDNSTTKGNAESRKSGIKQSKTGGKMATVVSAASIAADFIKRGKIYDDSDANVKRLIELHRVKLYEMQLERQRRLTLLEQAKKEAPPPPVVEPEKKLSRLPSTKGLIPKQYQNHSHSVQAAATTVLAVKKFEHNKQQSHQKTDSEGVVEDSTELVENKENENNSIEMGIFLDELPLPTATVAVVPQGRTRSTSNSKVVTKIMDAMKTAASTADRDKIIRANNFLHSVPPPPNKDKVSNKHTELVHSKQSGAPHHTTYVHKKHEEPVPMQIPKVKRPPVPSQAGAVDLQKSKAERETEEAREQLRQLEAARFEKYNSDEALAKSRAALQRRVALKAARKAEKERQEQLAEAEKKEKLEQLASDAKKKLQLAKVRFNEPTTNAVDKKTVSKDQKLKQKMKSSASLLQTNPEEDVSNRQLSVQPQQHVDSDHEIDNDADNDLGHNHEESGQDSDHESVQSEECSVDSLELVTEGLAPSVDLIRGNSGLSLTQQTKPVLTRVNTQSPKPNIHNHDVKIKFQLSSPTSSSTVKQLSQTKRLRSPIPIPIPAIDDDADENPMDSSRVMTAEMETIHSPYCREEVHYISSAKEDYSDLIENFQVEQFFDQQDSDDFVPLFTSFNAPPPPQPASTHHDDDDVVRNQHPQQQKQVQQQQLQHLSHGGPSSVSGGVHKVHTKPVHVPIPKSLQSTPYFSDYKKHSKHLPTSVTTQQYNSHGGKPLKGGSVNKKHGHKMVPHSQPQTHNSGSKVGYGISDDDYSVSNESYPPSQKKSLGRVASLMEIVERARKKQQESASAAQLQQQQQLEDSPPKPPAFVPQHNSSDFLAHQQQHNHDTSSMLSSIHPLSIPPQSTCAYQGGPLSAYGLATNTTSVVPTMSFKKFASMSPSIPLPPINSTDLQVLKSAKVSVSSVMGKSSVQPSVASHISSAQLGSVTIGSINTPAQQLQVQQTKQKKNKKTKTLNFTASTPILNSTAIIDSQKPVVVSKKIIRKSTPKVSKHGPIFEVPDMHSDDSDNDEDEEVQLQREYAERKSAFVKKVAEATAASSVNSSVNNTAPHTPLIRMSSDNVTAQTQQSLTKSITELYAEQMNGAHEVSTRDLLDAWSMEEQQEIDIDNAENTEYGEPIVAETDEYHGEGSVSMHNDDNSGRYRYQQYDEHEHEGDDSPQESNADREVETEGQLREQELSIDDDMCNALLQNLSFKING